jgi:DNA-binding beta-propeller fold protein YncE
VSEFAAGVSPVTAGAVRPDGDGPLVGAADGTVRVIDLADKAVVARLDGPARPVRAVGFAGVVVVAGWEDGTVRWSPGGKAVHLPAPVSAVAAAGPARRAFVTTTAGRVSGIDLDSGRTVDRTEPLFANARCLAVSPDGGWVAAAPAGGTVAVGLLPDLRVKAEFPVPGMDPFLAISPDGRHVLVPVRNGSVGCLRTDGARR